jgi:hypothetical protein
MKTQKIILFITLLALSFTACRKKELYEPIDTSQKPATILEGEILENKTLTADRVWLLKGFVVVKNNSVLTIEPGTIIKGAVGQKSALVIAQGSKIMANGTANSPIVFTSAKDPGSRAPGDWGGIILVGRAPTNRTVPIPVEGGIGITYGTDNIPNDNSGIMRYVRIEYAGIGANDSEINALTLYSVGSGTTLEYIQTVYANDDAYEFFGGTVNAKYLVAYATADDDFDFDFGYTGSIQFAVALRDPAFVDAADAGNGIECDNDKDGSDFQPITRPQLSNFTIVGPNNAQGTAGFHNFGNRWRRGTKFVFNNSIIIGSQKGGFSIESDKTANFYKNGASEFKNNIVAPYINPFLSNSAAFTAANMSAKALAEGCITSTPANVLLTNPFTLNGPNFLPLNGSPALEGTFATTPGATAVNYRGAFGATNWTSSWANWTPQQTVYPN